MEQFAENTIKVKNVVKEENALDLKAEPVPAGFTSLQSLIDQVRASQQPLSDEETKRLINSVAGLI